MLWPRPPLLEEIIPDSANDDSSNSRASGGWGHRPQTPFLDEPRGKSLPRICKKNGVWGQWPQPPEAILLLHRNFPSVEIQEFWYYPSMGRIYRLSGLRGRQRTAAGYRACRGVPGGRLEQGEAALRSQRHGPHRLPYQAIPAPVLAGALASLHLESARARFDRNEWRGMPDPVTAAAAFRAGELDWWIDPRLGMSPQLARNRQVQVERIEFSARSAPCRPTRYSRP